LLVQFGSKFSANIDYRRHCPVPFQDGQDVSAAEFAPLEFEIRPLA
jgi:hypothetical protein